MSIAHDKPKRPRSSGAQCAYFILNLLIHEGELDAPHGCPLCARSL